MSEAGPDAAQDDGQRIAKVMARAGVASRRQSEKLIAEGRFREDLWYRLNVIQLELPPLRARPDDIPALAHRLLAFGRLPIVAGCSLSRFAAHYCTNISSMSTALICAGAITRLTRRSSSSRKR